MTETKNYAFQQVKNEFALHKTGTQDPDRPMFTTKKVAKNSYEINLIRAEKGCS